MKPKPALAADRKDEDRTAYLATVDEGLADAKAGRVVSYVRIRRWLLSWGSEKELPPPKCP